MQETIMASPDKAKVLIILMMGGNDGHSSWDDSNIATWQYHSDTSSCDISSCDILNWDIMTQLKGITKRMTWNHGELINIMSTGPEWKSIGGKCYTTDLNSERQRKF